MRTLVCMWGNSLAVRLPKAMADEVGITADSAVEIRVVDGALLLSPLDGREKRLAKLVSLITAENRHEADDFTGPAGRERL